MPATVLLTSLVSGPLLDSGGAQLGRVEDVIARLDGGDQLPPVTGLKVRIGGRELFVPATVAQLESASARTSTTKLDLAQFERRPGEVLLRQDMLGRSVINVRTARLIAVRDVELEADDGGWRVAGIDPRVGPGLRRFLPQRWRGAEQDRGQFVPWSETEPFVGHVPTARLRLAPRRLARLHPAQIADLVEAASHEEGKEILQAVGHDKELEADVFEELDDEHQTEFLRDRSDEEVAAVLGRMESDDAADLLIEIEQERRLAVLELLPTPQQLKVKRLLGHNPSTAGGLMNPDFASIPAAATVGQALEYIRSSDLSAPQLLTAWVLAADGRLAGAVLASELMRAQAGSSVTSLIELSVPVVSPETDLPEVARLMADYNLLAIPVTDHDQRPIGVISVDDVLELLLPAQWRRRAGQARD